MITGNKFKNFEKAIETIKIQKKRKLPNIDEWCLMETQMKNIIIGVCDVSKHTHIMIVDIKDGYIDYFHLYPKIGMSEKERLKEIKNIVNDIIIKLYEQRGYKLWK